MSFHKEIGGYFELEVRDGHFLHDNLIRLNSGRNAFEYILKVTKPKKVYFPKFTCDVMLEPLNKLGVEYEFYSINKDFEIVNKPTLQKDELILYTNYFGLKDKYCRTLNKLYKQALVLDCSQSYYFKPLKHGYTLYSPRKFFGVSDGGLVSVNRHLTEELEVDVSFKRLSHLTQRLELGAEAGYENFKNNDNSLVNNPIRRMSVLTQRILAGVDFSSVKKKRLLNFKYLHEKLESINQLKIKLNAEAVPMVYPLLISNAKAREHFIDNKIFIALYWPNVLEWCSEDELEYFLSKNILPLPIDQRYSIEDMKQIVKVLDEIIS